MFIWKEFYIYVICKLEIFLKVFFFFPVHLRLVYMPEVVLTNLKRMQIKSKPLALFVTCMTLHNEEEDIPIKIKT